jgi:hypothetical protein
MYIAIFKKDTFLELKGELSLIIRVKIIPTYAPKNTKKGIVWLDFIKAFEGFGSE